MSLRIGVLGAGGVGGYVGGRLALAGANVTLLSQRRENVEHVRRHGLRLDDTQGERIARPAILHVDELPQTAVRPFDIVLLCVKSYDTVPMCSLIAGHLAPDGCIVSMQNGINEDDIAAVVGVERVLGAVMSTISVNAVGLGHVIRTSAPGGEAHTVFRVGRPDGTITPRIGEVVDLLSAVDSAAATDNLRGERWAKLVANSISHGLSAATGLTTLELLNAAFLGPLILGLAAEGICVGRAMDYSLVPIYGAQPDAWVAAAGGDARAAAVVDRCLGERLGRLTEMERPSVSQDLLRGRRTEIEFTNGLLVRRAHELGLAVPAQEAVLGIVRRIERGGMKPDPRHIAHLLAGEGRQA